jgi:hypothetical protein
LALVDLEMQQIAWDQHGFRTGLIDATNDPAAITIAMLADTVVPMPSARLMADIVEAVQ